LGKKKKKKRNKRKRFFSPRGVLAKSEGAKKNDVKMNKKRVK